MPLMLRNRGPSYKDDDDNWDHSEETTAAVKPNSRRIEEIEEQTPAHKKLKDETSMFNHPSLFYLPKGVNQKALDVVDLRKEIEKGNLMVFKNSRQKIYPTMKFLGVGFALQDGSPLVVTVDAILTDLYINDKGKPEFLMDIQSASFLTCMRNLGLDLGQALTNWLGEATGMRDTPVEVLPFTKGDQTVKAGWQYKYRDILPIEVISGKDRQTYQWADYNKLYDKDIQFHPYASVRLLLSPWSLNVQDKKKFLCGIKPNVQAIEIKVKK